MERPPHPDRTPLEDGPVEAMMAQADDYASNQPQNYREIIDRYHQVRSRAIEPNQQEVLNRKVQSWIEQHQNVSGQAIGEFKIRMQEKLRAGKPQEAFVGWKGFPMNLRSRETDQQIQEIVERSLPPDFRPE